MSSALLLLEDILSSAIHEVIQMEKTNKWKKGYVDMITCADGTNSHEWTTKDYSGEGTIQHCEKCGYYC